MGAQEAREIQLIDEKRRCFVQLLMRQKTVCQPVVSVSVSFRLYLHHSVRYICLCNFCHAVAASCLLIKKYHMSKG